MKIFSSLLLYFGIFIVIFRNILVYTIGSLTPGYSSMGDFISELSSEGSPYETLMNTGSLIFFGMALILVSRALLLRLPAPSGGLAMAYMAISGLGFMFIGLFPCPPGCRPELDTTQMSVHTLSGFVASVSVCLSALVYGLKYFKGDRSLIRTGSLTLGITGITAFVLLWITIVATEFGLDLGLYQLKGFLQRVNMASGDLWVLLACVYCLSSSSELHYSYSKKQTSSTLA